MGEDISASDCSWKKLVIAKTNNEWVTTIKHGKDDAHKVKNNTNKHWAAREQKDAQTININNFGSDGGETVLRNIKKEQEVGITITCEQQDEEPEMLQEVDPLMIASKRTRRRRKTVDNETQSERAVRLAKMSAYAAQRLANESPEQRATRLKRMSEYAAKRLSQETSEQRAKRLARMSAYAAKRLAEETPEQRRARLSRMSAYAARRQALKKLASGTTDSVANFGYFNSQMINNLMSNQS